VSVPSHTRALVFFIVLLTQGGGAFAQIEGIGFQARLDVRSTIVSSYDEPANRFSAAMYPLSYAALSNKLVFTPKASDQGNFDNGSFSFSTRISGNVELVPVSVDARNYYNHRVSSTIDEKWRGFATNTVARSKQGGGREGLSIGVNLPKRFDQMFGEGGANLRVSGNYRITFSGRSQWDDAARSGIMQQSKFPALNMEQVSRFTIQGTIGTKISVSVSQDNQTDIPLANRLILRYKGDDDDIVKTIEAGNTTLNIPNTQFVGYSQHIQGLFGLKTEAQLGNLSLTAIASQEKGSSESSTVSASGEENAEYVRDYAYLQGRIFDLAYPGEIGKYDRVERLWVYDEESNQQSTDAERMYLKTGSAVLSYDGDMLMTEVPPEQFELLYGQDPVHCPIALVFYSARQRTLGVRMEITRYSAESVPTGRIDTIGYTGPGMDTLRIIQPQTKDNFPSHPAWQLMWRNCYRIPQNLTIDDIDVKIRKGLAGREEATSNLEYQDADGVAQDPYLKILGLDQWNNNQQGVKIPDGKLDPYDAVFRSDWGMLIFPEREPFNSNRVFVDANNDASDTLIDKVPALYYYQSPIEKQEASEYYIQSSTKTRSATIRLGRANVIEGSERVTLNGRQLTKGTDYDISYDMGQVTLLTDEATDPNADVQVQFQYAPFMALQKKTLLGMRAEYAHSEDLKFGATVLYKSDKAQERKPRVGQETAKAAVMDFDISFGLAPKFLTKMIDALPLISTEAESRIRVTAEVAQSRPNPNVDGAAYIDDFESAVELQSLGNVRNNWTLASVPIDIKDNANSWTRGTIRWHNPPAISREDVYQIETAAGQGALHPLRLIFRPHGYKYTGSAQDPCSDSVASESWGGIMRSFANRVDEKRVQLFEVRAKGGKGVLHFDFGRISEDINGNDKLENEDRSDPPNGTLDDGEDTGLDLKTDAAETDDCGQVYDADNLPDPAGDNWWYEFKGKGVGVDDNGRPPIPREVWNSPGYQEKVNDPNHWLHYEWQNGTEGNIDDDAVQGLPDNEALSKSFEKRNSYFTFALPLNAEENNPYLVPGSGRNGWYTYRVPVREPDVLDTVSEGGEIASWAQVTHVRVWFGQDNPGADSLTDMDSVLIADWGFVQSNWRDTLRTQPSDSLSEFFIASVSEDNGTFVPPPGVEPYVDKVNNVTEAQRGLAMVFNQLQPGAEGTAMKELLTTESYSGYRRMEMYVHGDSSINRDDSLMFYFRLGLDSLNYYEFRTLLEPGWASPNYVNILFDSITALKDRADRALVDRKTRLEDSTEIYRVVGRPNINEVKFLSASVRNYGGSAISGDVWLDELRVTEVRKDVGTAARVLVSGSLADLATYSFSYEHRDAYFRGLSQATRGGSRDNLGSGQVTDNLSAGGSFDVGRFLPRSWTARMPVSYRYTESIVTPLLRNNSDVVLPPETREAEKNIARSINVTLSESFARKGSSLLFNALLNRQKVSFSYTRARQQKVTNPYIFAENYNFRADFEMGVSKPPEIPIFFWTKPIPLLKRFAPSKFSVYPSRWTWNATFNRNLQATDDIDLNRTSSFSRKLDGRMDLSYRLFPTLNVNYNMGTRRDMTDPSLVNIAFRNFKLGQEDSYNQSFQATYDPKLFEFFTETFSYMASYTDNFDSRTQTHTASLTKNWSVSGDFKHQLLFDIGRKQSAGGKSTARTGTARGGRSEEEPEKKPGKPFYAPILKGLKFLTGWMQPFRYQYSQGFNRSIPGILDKLPWKNRLGFDSRADFPSTGSNRNPSAGESESLDLSSGFSLLGGISTTVSYKTKTSRSLTSVGTDRTESITTSWPELSIQIRRFTTLPLLKKYVNWFIDIFSPRTGYSRQISEVRSLDGGFAISRTETINRSPVISLNLKLFSKLSLSGSYGNTLSIEEKANRSNGTPEYEVRTTKETIAVSTKYAFSAPTGISIPIFGKLKFKSMVTIDLGVQYGSNRSEKSNLGKPAVVFTDNSSFAASPVISYTFSNQIRGGLTVRWQDTNDLQRHRKSHVREVQLWTEIHF
jgi:hypothetical protein